MAGGAWWCRYLQQLSECEKSALADIDRLTASIRRIEANLGMAPDVEQDKLDNAKPLLARVVAMQQRCSKMKEKETARISLRKQKQARARELMSELGATVKDLSGAQVRACGRLAAWAVRRAVHPTSRAHPPPPLDACPHVR